MVLSDKYQSSYARRMTDAGLYAAATCIGLNSSSGDFNSSKLTFAAEFDDVDFGPTSGMAVNPRGAVMSWDLPPLPPREIQLRIHDWDMDIRTQLEAWKFASTTIRWWVPGMLFAVARINSVKLSRPQKRLLEVTLLIRGIFYYDTDDPDVVNNVFPSAGDLLTDGRFMGELT